MAKKGNLTEIVLGDKTSFVQSNDLETNLYNRMIEGLERRDESILKDAVRSLLTAFLQDKVRLNFVSFTTSAFLNLRVVEEKYKDFEFKDKTLAKVYSKLNILEHDESDEAKKKARTYLERLMT